MIQRKQWRKSMMWRGWGRGMSGVRGRKRGTLKHSRGEQFTENISGDCTQRLLRGWKETQCERGKKGEGRNNEGTRGISI